MKSAWVAVLMLGIALPSPAWAQAEEIVVTAARRETDDYNAEVPAVGLRRTADFAIVQTRITGDSRDREARQQEIYAMLAAAIAAAPGQGLQLAYGDSVVQPLTLANYKDMSLVADNRPDSQHVSFLIKAPLSQGADARSAESRITAFIKKVKPVGRAVMENTGDLTLSVVNPDQYRAAVLDLIAADGKALAARLGPDYGVSIEGLSRPIEWSRAGLSEVLLFVPYKLTVAPKK